MAALDPAKPDAAWHYPRKHFETVRALGAFKLATVVRTEDDAGREVFIVSWQARTREFKQLSDVERFVETLPRPRAR